MAWDDPDENKIVVLIVLAFFGVCFVILMLTGK